ncbi:MAG: TlpA family protein disulfide reductase [Deltaproteobacteria bacterium]|nr:TlpA family protein disulfide reductase [Deltaproteobacteria bacterium]
MLLQLTGTSRPRYLSNLAVPVVLGLLVSCGDQAAPNADDEDRLVRDGGEHAEETSAPAAPPAGSAKTREAARAIPAALPQTGRPAPDLKLPDLETGQPWSLAAHVDPSGESCPKAVLLAFMASWCSYCTASLPTLVELERANPELAVVTVSVDATDAARKEELAKVRKAGLTGPVLAADEAAIQTWIGGGKSVPKYYFVNHDGIVTGKDDGFGDKVKPMMPAQARRALAN